MYNPEICDFERALEIEDLFIAGKCGETVDARPSFHHFAYSKMERVVISNILCRDLVSASYQISLYIKGTLVREITNLASLLVPLL